MDVSNYVIAWHDIVINWNSKLFCTVLQLWLFQRTSQKKTRLNKIPWHISQEATTLPHFVVYIITKIFVFRAKNFPVNHICLIYVVFRTFVPHLYLWFIFRQTCDALSLSGQTRSLYTSWHVKNIMQFQPK